jgi:hypothetical protein
MGHRSKGGVDVVWGDAQSAGHGLPPGAAGGSLTVMAEEARTNQGPELQGTAGYVSPYPYLEKLQPRMDERLNRQIPRGGQYCGFCYGRLRKDATRCGFCGGELAETGIADEIPQEVLRAYLAKKKTEERWVHMGAFFGLIVASFLFLYLVAWGPGFLGHPGVALAVLIGGGYLLAQLFGPLIGAQVGYRRGSRKRDAMWARWLESEERRAGNGE